MSEPPARHVTADAPPPHPDDVGSGLPRLKATRTVRFWSIPIVVTVGVLAALAAFYLGGILTPMTNLRHFPIAVVNEDAGPTGAQVVKGLLAGFDRDAYDVRVLGHDDARRQLDTAQIYGVAVIPPSFSSRLQAFAKSAVTPGRVERPIILVSTNPRAGTLGASIAGQTLDRAINMMDRQVGERLLQEVAQQTGPAPMPAAVKLMLANPIQVESTVHKVLPDGTGNGLSAFYYALLLVLAGFTGSVVVSMLVDSMLGFQPARFGPAQRSAEQAQTSRFRALLIKWALMVVLGLLTSGVYMFVADQLGMPIGHAFPLWLFGAFAIAAVGIASTSLIAVLGAVGVLVSIFVFVILGLPSAGATVPLQATPPFFGWLANVDPMHQVFLGTRALLYLDAQADAGLSQGLTMSAIGLAVGLLLGGIATHIYDRRGYHRSPLGPNVTESAETTRPAEWGAGDEVTPESTSTPE
jgi:uncharacterized phage infection (PIP) family protein YhgE